MTTVFVNGGIYHRELHIPGEMFAAQLIKSGKSTNGNVYSASVLEASAQRFNGAPVFMTHDPLGTTPLGHVHRVQYVGTKDGGALVGVISPTDGRVKRQLLESTHAGMPCGLSVKTVSTVTRTANEAQVHEIHHVQSVDLVPAAAAGGFILTEADGLPISWSDRRASVLMEPMRPAVDTSRHLLEILESRPTPESLHAKLSSLLGQQLERNLHLKLLEAQIGQFIDRQLDLAIDRASRRIEITECGGRVLWPIS